MPNKIPDAMLGSTPADKKRIEDAGYKSEFQSNRYPMGKGQLVSKQDTTAKVRAKAPNEETTSTPNMETIRTPDTSGVTSIFDR